jgi:ATP-binding cassette subfamily B (MDR/TAP) protein 1
MKKYSIYAGLAIATVFSAMLFAYALSFWYGSKLVNEKINNGTKAYGVGDVLIIFFSIITSGMNLSQVTPCLKKFSEGQQAAAKIYSVIDRKPKIVNI